MYIAVELLNGYKKLLTYSVPETIQKSLLGSIVQVPLANRVEFGLVVDEFEQIPRETSFVIKSIISVATVPQDTKYTTFLEQLSWYYQIDNAFFIRRIRTCLYEKKIKEENGPFDTVDSTIEGSNLVVLTSEQQKVVNAVHEAVQKEQYEPIVLAGVTGSGKTEVYKQLILEALLLRKSVIFLLPEVTLAHRFEQLFIQQLPHWVKVHGFHSKTTLLQRQLLWNRLLVNEPVVIIGVHLPVLLPIVNLGLIIVDEEHESGYQEKHHPKIHTVEAALIRAKQYHIPILLGSATPSMSTLYNVQTRKWKLFRMTKRFGGIFPTIAIVPLLQNKKRKFFWISFELELAIADRLKRGEQTIIFLNRRGLSFSLQCSSCGFVYRCYHCSVSLTVHENNTLLCHYCGYSKSIASQCSGCGVVDQFITKGVGTQKLVQMLQNLFPQARIARVDLDVTKRKRVWQKVLQKIDAGQIDIIIGTQSIAKGFHFPKVSLVGVIWADANLHFPHFAATEQVLQQLIQVAGRAGRAGLQSTVIVQTITDHEVFSYVDENRYFSFFEVEIQNRQDTGYPPVMRFAEIELKHKIQAIVEQEAEMVSQELFQAKKHINETIMILGPVQPLVYKIKGVHVRKLYIKAERFEQIANLFEKIDKNHYKSHLFFTPNPIG